MGTTTMERNTNGEIFGGENGLIREENGRAVISLPHELESDHAEVLRSFMLDCGRASLNEVCVDLGRVRNLSALGLTLLAMLPNQRENRGRQITFEVIHVPDHLMGLLRLTGLMSKYRISP